MGKRRYFYFVIGIVLLAAFSITGISLLISSPALYVENIKISKEEAEFFVSEEKSASYAYFAGKYNADTSVSSFRNTQFDGITPEEYARERALKNIVETKNILLLAKEAGMAESVSYSDIRKDWKEFVAARKNAVESNEIVYGPVEMSFSDYYSYYISKIKLEMFEQYKVDNRLQESETRQYYESHKELFSQGDEISLLVYSVPDAADGNGESTLKQIKKEIELSDFYYDDSIGYYAVRYLGRKEGSGLSYDEVRNRLEDMIMTEQFQRYLTDREEELSVTVVDRVYDTIKWN